MDPTDETYQFEMTVGEAAIQSIVKQTGATKSADKITNIVKDMLNDAKVAEPTRQQMERKSAPSEMADGFKSRLRRAFERVRNADHQRDVGCEVEFLDTRTYTGDNDGVKEVDDLGARSPTVVAAVKKVDYNAGRTVQSVYPLVEVGEHCVCPCQDRHYNRQQGGTCYHELSYAICVARDSSRPSGDLTIRV